jgi:hypothetical protein
MANTDCIRCGHPYDTHTTHNLWGCTVARCVCSFYTCNETTKVNMKSGGETQPELGMAGGFEHMHGLEQVEHPSSVELIAGKIEDIVSRVLADARAADKEEIELPFDAEAWRDSLTNNELAAFKHGNGLIDCDLFADAYAKHVTTALLQTNVKLESRITELMESRKEYQQLSNNQAYEIHTLQQQLHQLDEQIHKERQTAGMMWKQEGDEAKSRLQWIWDALERECSQVCVRPLDWERNTWQTLQGWIHVVAHKAGLLQEYQVLALKHLQRAEYAERQVETLTRERDLARTERNKFDAERGDCTINKAGLINKAGGKISLKE